MGAFTYNPKIFDATNIADAKAIILTAEDSTTEKRWATETPYIADLISRSFKLTEQSIVLDYGCGIGRLAKEFIARHKCWVVGVDISTNMRALAAAYVASDRFFSCAPEMLAMLIECGVVFDIAVSVWVLQHCLRPADDVALMHRALKPDGGLFVVNQDERRVPTIEQLWVDDKIDVKMLLSKNFSVKAQGLLSREMTTESLSKIAFWAAYQRA
jgi:SAM-dependent methyltransferase